MSIGLSIGSLDFLLWVMVCFYYTYIEIDVIVSFDLSALCLGEKTRKLRLVTNYQPKNYY